MLNNTRFLHILIGGEACETISGLNGHLLKRKYPGEHVALVRLEDELRIKKLDFFHEIYTIDCKFLQRSAFSAILGDATAFKELWDSLYSLTQASWSRIFNLQGSAAETALASLFNCPIIGPYSIDGKTLCSDSPSKLNTTIKHWQMSHPWIDHLLQRCSLQQLDLNSVEKRLQAVTDLKTKTPPQKIRGVVIGMKLLNKDQDCRSTIEFLNQLFVTVALDTRTAQKLNDYGLSFIDWSDTPTEEHFFLDLIVQDVTAVENFWTCQLDISGKDPSQLTDDLGELIPRNFTKWSCLSFFFDYLSAPRLAVIAEKNLTRYERQSLRPFLQREVLGLKEFAKVLLEGLRRQDDGCRNFLADYWATYPSVLSFVAAIETSLQPSLVPIFRHDQDIIAVKHRLRSLNQFYERIHRACTLEIPTTDLALTL